ncbi:MAG: RHS repeat-associated core domain-containing protein [Anaerolineaceae bacterium]|nr:RHS repeat-associated core domain-containing protein [Anaerolineaceae bacterium]
MRSIPKRSEGPAFGEVRASSGLTSTGYRYTGQLDQPEVGLQFYEARFYDPQIMHFVQADTIVPDPENPIAWDRYAYAGNNPILYNDPSGHIFWPVILPIIGGFIFFSQVPGDTYHSDSRGNSDVMLIGLSFISPALDFAATSVDCLTNGCEPTTSYSSYFVPGPSPSMVENTIESAAKQTDEIACSKQLWSQPNFSEMDDFFQPSTNSDTIFESYSTLKPGPYAVESLPARSYDRNWTVYERNMINEFGDKYGCHTCGTKDPGTRSGNWYLDHQPASKLIQNNQPQRLFPQCKNCSNKQGGEVRSYFSRLPNY